MAGGEPKTWGEVDSGSRLRRSDDKVFAVSNQGETVLLYCIRTKEAETVRSDEAIDYEKWEFTPTGSGKFSRMEEPQ